jgi:hypothetical protein
MGGACNMHGRDEKLMQNLVQETWKDKTPYEFYAGWVAVADISLFLVLEVTQSPIQGLNQPQRLCIIEWKLWW